jgi:hypothetical protein
VTVYEVGVPPELPAATVAVTLAVPATTVGAGGVPGTDTVGVGAAKVTGDDATDAPESPAVFFATALTV